MSAARPVVFPRDDAPHDAVTEWWYYNGHLQSNTGEQYGFELVVFKRLGRKGRSGYVAHVAVTDRQRKAFQFSEAVALPPPATGLKTGFDLHVGDVRAKGALGIDAIMGTTQDYRLDLTLTAQKPPALHGGAGYVGVGGTEPSYYYSRTRLAVQGAITDHGVEMPVTGLAWMDHQWGDFTLEGDGGWDWFSVQLDDETDVMVVVVRDGQQRELLAYGTLVDQDGQTTHLTGEHFKATATGSWTSPATEATYPMGWTLSVPQRGLSLRIDPVLFQQEMDTSASVGRSYWEGEVVVSGTKQGQAISGVGYVELTGYQKRADPAAPK